MFEKKNDDSQIKMISSQQRFGIERKLNEIFIA